MIAAKCFTAFIRSVCSIWAKGKRSKSTKHTHKERTRQQTAQTIFINLISILLLPALTFFGKCLQGSEMALLRFVFHTDIFSIPTLLPALLPLLSANIIWTLVWNGLHLHYIATRELSLASAFAQIVLKWWVEIYFSTEAKLNAFTCKLQSIKQWVLSNLWEKTKFSNDSDKTFKLQSINSSIVHEFWRKSSRC